MVADNTRPLVIQDGQGAIIGLKAMNQKAFRKSRENGILWIYLAENGRVLPYREDLAAGSLLSLGETEYGYLARVAIPTESGGETVADEDSSEKVGNGLTGSPAVPSLQGRDVLSDLAKVIASRRQNLPEGSYTTHLFRSGPDKIRKKLGEEAVELILARERSEVVYETADLFYHTLVLLEALEIPLSEILDELDRRS